MDISQYGSFHVHVIDFKSKSIAILLLQIIISAVQVTYLKTMKCIFY